MRLFKKHRWFRDHRMPVRIVICKARRAGLSTGVEALMYDDTTNNPNTDSLIIANESKPSENLLNMCTIMWRNTPEFMEVEGRKIKIRPDLPPEFRNNPPKDKLYFDAPLNSRIFLATAKSIDAYLSFGFQNMHGSEASRYADGHELFRAVYPTLSIDPHSALYIESTPNGQEGRGRWFYELVMDAHARKKTEYGEMALVFIPWHEMRYSFSIPFGDGSEQSAFERSYAPSERAVLRRFPHITAEQMRWRRMMINGPTFNRDEELFDQEYPNDLATCFLMAGTSVFSRKSIKRLTEEHVRPPVWEGDVYWGESEEKNRSVPIHEAVRMPHFYKPWEAQERGFRSHVNERTFKNLRVYRWPNKGDRLIIGADVASGNEDTKAGDESTVCVGCLNDMRRDELLMTWRGHLNPIAFAEVLAALAWGLAAQVGERAVLPELAPEWQGADSGGITCCTYLDKKKLYPKLYLYETPGVKNMPPGRHVGWESNAKTKPMMVDYTLRMVEKDLIEIPSEELVLQMSSYRQKDSFGDAGSYGGASGRHDDLVSSFQIMCTLLRLRAATIPGDADVEYVRYDSDELGESWDPFTPSAAIAGLPGVRWQDVGEENTEEAAFWSSGGDDGGMGW